jgi:hypothetical protein
MLCLSSGKDQLLSSTAVYRQKLLRTGQTLWQWSRRSVWWHFKHCWPSRKSYRDQGDETLRYNFQTQTGSLNAFWISEKGKTNSEKSACATFTTHGFQHLRSQDAEFRRRLQPAHVLWCSLCITQPQSEEMLQLVQSRGPPVISCHNSNIRNFAKILCTTNWWTNINNSLTVLPLQAHNFLVVNHIAITIMYLI